ncbi:MAG: CbbX protein [Actinobacteria bacterium]|nr:CbbX protein [Actinomycetota bacterium]MBI3688609.1 CbbX protein [Actinomycetota bacterium]
MTRPQHQPFRAQPASSAAARAEAQPPAGPPPLAPDAKVDLQAARAESGVEKVLTELDTDLVGMVPVKARIAEIAALLLVDGQRARFGLSGSTPGLHMSFTGSPGTGKTTVALRMAEMLHRLGYSRRGHLVSVTRDDLVGQYVGHTAPKTKDALKRAMGGVLFIDEAYYLFRAENERDYGQEAIEILLQVMEEHRDDLVVIFAGYADRMDQFFAANPGLSSRVAHHIDFPDYSIDELMAIGQLMVAREGYRFAESTLPVLREYLSRRSRQPRFANARSVRNALERARLRHANRLLESGLPVSRDDLMELRPEDFLSSRVFTDPVDGTPAGPATG